MATPDPIEQGELLQQAKLRALAELAAGAGHEINNPVATILGHVQLLLARETDPERRQSLATIGGQAYRIRDMISDLMLFARPPEPRRQTIDLSAAVVETAGKLQPDLGDGCRIEINASTSVPIWADRVQVHVVISSLIRNSVEAIEGRGVVRVRSSAAVREGVAGGLLEVSDNGTGFSELEREHLFDPFFSGRQAGRGLGFGLSKCWRIVSLHGGAIWMDSNPEQGTKLSVFWPAEPASGGIT